VTAYDEVPYDTEANPAAHPRAMATLAHLFGVPVRAPSTARVLEIGCGDGEHILGAASYMPGARFVGFDLAADAIARGVAMVRASGTENVELLHRDVRDVAAGRTEHGVGGKIEDASFDYVVAHGVYSWVPEATRGDVLTVVRRALAPSGIGFLSMNATPGWELRRALRMLMREAAAEHEAPSDKVRAALGLVDDLAASRGDGFIGVLAKAATEYRAHVTQATTPDAPFNRYVFHDLLAECNDPFSVAELEKRLRAARLAILCETPLFAARTRDFESLSAEMSRSGTPFLQVLVCREDAPRSDRPRENAIRTMSLWADLAPAGASTYRTTTGGVLQAADGSGLARAAAGAPGFVPVATLSDDEVGLARLEHDLFVASCEGMLTIATEPAPIRGASEKPCVSRHVRLHARAAVERGAKQAVLTSALHRSFRVAFEELIVVRELDGQTELSQIVERASCAWSGANEAHVTKVLDRFARHAFLVDERSRP
jgi:SAM-dependent methyltransferase